MIKIQSSQTEITYPSVEVVGSKQDIRHVTLVTLAEKIRIYMLISTIASNKKPLSNIEVIKLI
jgi:hypothetical protein